MHCWACWIKLFKKSIYLKEKVLFCACSLFLVFAHLLLLGQTLSDFCVGPIYLFIIYLWCCCLFCLCVNGSCSRAFNITCLMLSSLLKWETPEMHCRSVSFLKNSSDHQRISRLSPFAKHTHLHRYGLRLTWWGSLRSV